MNFDNGRSQDHLVATLLTLPLNSSRIEGIEFQSEKQKNGTVYKIVYSDVTEKPEMQFISLKRLVGERGFEPPTPWSRTRFRHLLKSVEFHCFQVIDVEPVAGCSSKAIEPR